MSDLDRKVGLFSGGWKAAWLQVTLFVMGLVVKWNSEYPGLPRQFQQRLSHVCLFKSLRKTKVFFR